MSSYPAVARTAEDAPAVGAQAARAVKILRTSNIAQVHRYVPEVFTFSEVQPYAVVRFVRRVLEPVEGAWYCFAHPNGVSGKMLVVAPESTLVTLRPLMAALDREGLTSAAGGDSLNWHLRNRDPLDPALLESLRLHGTPEVRVYPDPETNQLVVRDTTSGVLQIAEALGSLDVAIPQVTLEVALYEVDVTDDQRLGLDYASWKNGPGRNLFAIGAFAEQGRSSSRVAPPGGGKGTLVGLPGASLETAGRSAAWLLDVPSAYFDALVVSGRATTLSRISVAVMSGSEAALEIGDSVQFDQAVSDVDDAFARTRTPSRTPREVSEAFVGSVLRISPWMLDDGVRLQVFASKVVLKGFGDDGVPLLGGRALSTELYAPYESECVLCGMVGGRGVDSAQKAPWLGDLPIVGALFGGTARSAQRTLVVIVIRVGDRA